MKNLRNILLCLLALAAPCFASANCRQIGIATGTRVVIESEKRVAVQGYSLSYYDGTMGKIAPGREGETANHILSDGARAIVNVAGAIRTKTLKDAVASGDVQYWRNSTSFGVDFQKGPAASSVEIIFDKPTVFGEVGEPIHPEALRVLSNLERGADQDDVFIALEYSKWSTNSKASKAEKKAALENSLTMVVEAEDLLSQGYTVGLIAKFADQQFRMVGAHGVLGRGGLAAMAEASRQNSIDYIIVVQDRTLLDGLSAKPAFTSIVTDLYKGGYRKMLFDSLDTFSAATTLRGPMTFNLHSRANSLYQCRAELTPVSIFGISNDFDVVFGIIRRPVGNSSMTMITSLLSRLTRAGQEKLLIAIANESTAKVDEQSSRDFHFNQR